ncbi:MAG: hypothetical protein IKA32_01870 [Lentisphaeria bacterium]|nr:hypothetical protein [Lentisphaeria bacterium]
MRLLFLSSILFLCGCASSERMARLSGGVVQEYSVPGKHRLRSVKFQKKTASFSGEENKKRSDFAEKSLVNIWPFFFRSDDYYSVLWPFFDYDPYGLAVRPFFNKEGDDYSILFPLSSWNVASKDGWVTFLYWEKDRIGFFPLADFMLKQNRGALYCTPLFIRSWYNNPSPGWFSREKENVFTSLALAYFQRSLEVDTSQYSYLVPHNSKYPQYLKELLAYKLHGTNTPVPRNKKELDAFRKKIFAGCPVIVNRHYGFVPLFFAWDKKAHKGFNIAGILLNYSKKEHQSEMAGLFHLLYSYVYRKNSFHSFVSAQERWIIPPLLTYGGYKDYPVDSPRRRDALAFRTLAHNTHEPFAKNLPEMKKLYKKLTQKDMPQVICSYPVAREWIEEFIAAEKWQSQRETFGGFLPLYCFYSGRKNYFRTIPALLTFSNIKKDGSFFLSIPLLTYRNSNARESVTTTAWRLGYYNKIRKAERIGHPVFDRNTYWTESYQQHHFEDTYALAGLFYHGRDGFSIAKKGLDAKKIEEVRKQAFELKFQNRSLRNTEKHLARRVERNQKWQVKSRLDELKKLVDSEEIRIEKEKFDKLNKEFTGKVALWSKKAAGFGVRFDRTTLDEKNFNTALEKFLEKTTDIRFSEDYGSGIFFRKELAENGDYKWHIFAYLASGSRQGKREKTQILHFLYRSSKDGDREEKIIFPFVTIRKNKGHSSKSFLWRMWETHETPSGKGGYIFFIPWGQ